MALFFAHAVNGSAATIARHDFSAASEPGIKIFIREVTDPNIRQHRALLLVHGARVPGLASFDLRVPGGSLAEDLALSGYAVYVMDVRGYGSSTRPKEMSQPPGIHPPLVRSNEAARDIDAVVDWIRNHLGVRRVSVLGWATGGQWAGYYATLHSEKIDHLIIHNALYGANSLHPLLGHGSDMEDPAHPGQFNSANIGAYRCNTAASLLSGWNKNIRLDDKDSWRDPAVAQAYVREALASDPESSIHKPPFFRSPNGALEDSFYLATGRQLWDASFIYAPTLVIASELDFWSRPEDRQSLLADLIHAPLVRSAVIANATHFVHLDRAEHGRAAFLKEVVSFLATTTL